MEIGPVKDDRPFVERSVEAGEKSNEPSKSALKEDRVDISEESRRRFRTESDKPVDLATVQARIESGFYDSIQVREKVIDRLTDELLENIRQFYK